MQCAQFSFVAHSRTEVEIPMAKLHNYNGRYCEFEYENAIISFLEAEGWHYLPGKSISRTSQREVLYMALILLKAR